MNSPNLKKPMSDLIIDRQFAKFYISVADIRQYPEIVMDLLSTCLITDCRFDFSSQKFEYTAYSYAFNLIPENCLPPFIGIRKIFDQEVVSGETGEKKYGPLVLGAMVFMKEGEGADWQEVNHIYVDKIRGLDDTTMTNQ